MLLALSVGRKFFLQPPFGKILRTIDMCVRYWTWEQKPEPRGQASNYAEVAQQKIKISKFEKFQFLIFNFQIKDPKLVTEKN